MEANDGVSRRPAGIKMSESASEFERIARSGRPAAVAGSAARVQEQLFEAAVPLDLSVRNRFAVFLPTITEDAHPPKPTAFA